MTTDQIKDAESAVGATGGSTDPDAAFERATNEARQIIAKARYEAFRTVTGARNDADSILDNARSEAAANVAAIEANDMIAAENADLVAINAALRVEYNELLDAIDVSETLIEGFEVRLLDLATMPDSLASHAELLAGASAEVSAEVTPFVFDYSPSVWGNNNSRSYPSPPRSYCPCCRSGCPYCGHQR